MKIKSDRNKDILSDNALCFSSLRYARYFLKVDVTWLQNLCYSRRRETIRDQMEWPSKLERISALKNPALNLPVCLFFSDLFTSLIFFIFSFLQSHFSFVDYFFFFLDTHGIPFRIYNKIWSRITRSLNS